MCSSSSAIFASIVTILVSFEAILKRFSVRINFKSQCQSNVLSTTSFEIHQLVSITTILVSIVTILASIEQVNTP